MQNILDQEFKLRISLLRRVVRFKQLDLQKQRELINQPHVVLSKRPVQLKHLDSTQQMRQGADRTADQLERFPIVIDQLSTADIAVSTW